MQPILFAAIALLSAYLVTLGLCILRFAGVSNGPLEDVLCGAVATAAGLALALTAYFCRPE